MRCFNRLRGAAILVPMLPRSSAAILAGLLAVGVFAPALGLVCGGLADVMPADCCATSCPAGSRVVDNPEACCDRETAARRTTAPVVGGLVLVLAAHSTAATPGMAAVVPEPPSFVAVDGALRAAPRKFPPKDLVKLKTSFLI